MVTATEAKATILSLLDDVAAGEEVQITKHGRIVARLTPPEGARSVRGSLGGLARSVSEDEALFSTGADWDAAWAWCSWTPMSRSGGRQSRSA